MEPEAEPRHYVARPRIDALPLRVTSRFAAPRRAARITSTFARHFATFPVSVARAGRGVDRRDLLGHRLRGAAQDLGPTFVKLGQLLASSPSIAGDALADELRGLLDKGPSMRMEEIRRIVEEDTARPFDDVFSRFESTAHAAASLAVVHRATLVDGTDVAVKVLRPSTDRVIAEDLSVIQPMFRFLARQVPVGVITSLPDTVTGLAEQLGEELDLRNEARSMDWFRAMLELIDAKGVIVPRSFPDASGRRVLTMEFVEGRPVDDLGAVEDLGFDAKEAVQRLLQAWFAVTLCTGTFHGDMHAGNLLFTPDGQVVLLDWGILGRLEPASHRFLRRSIEAAMGDESAWDDVRTHIMTTVGAAMTQMSGLSEDDVFAMVRSQITMIMTEPFSTLNLMALVPQAPTQTGNPGEAPTSLRGWLRLIRSERRRLRRHEGEPPPVPDRGEMLLVKQLMYFERYGKLYLGDQPLIWDVDVYTTLLALPQDAPPTAV